MKHFLLNREFGPVRTVAVFGPGRGGTSVIAGCLRALGVCMGTMPHAYKHEWSPIVRSTDGTLDLPATRGNIQEMNANYERWGWKFPSDVFHIEEVTAFLRRPGFIVVTRDLTEIALSSLARQDVPFEISFYEAAHVARYIAARMRFWPWPILVLPFAEVLREANGMVETLCAFLQIDPDEERRRQAAEFVQPLTRGYRPFDARPDQLHDFNLREENLVDSRNLALDFSTRYSKEYLQHFEDLLKHTKRAADRFAAKIQNADQGQIASEMLDDLRQLSGSCGLPGINDMESRKANSFSAEGWHAAFNQELDLLTNVAQKAGREALSSTGGYDQLDRLFRAFKFLIRVRAAVEAGTHRLMPVSKFIS